MENILENNRIIAEFMGGKYDENTFAEPTINIDSAAYWIDELKYHTSWDWLMPIVEKIKNDHFFNLEIYGDFSCVWITKDKALPNNERKIYSEHKETLTAIHGAIVQFIQWYNSQSKTNNNG